MSYFIKGGRYKKKPIDDQTLQILVYMSYGMKTGEIATTFGISKRDIRNKLIAAMNKLGCLTYYHLLATVIRDGTID